MAIVKTNCTLTLIAISVDLFKFKIMSKTAKEGKWSKFLSKTMETFLPTIVISIIIFGACFIFGHWIGFNNFDAMAIIALILAVNLTVKKIVIDDVDLLSERLKEIEDEIDDIEVNQEDIKEKLDKVNE